MQDVNDKINTGYEIMEFHLLYNSNTEKFSKVYGKKCCLTLDPMNALKFWEETSHCILGMMNAIANDEDIEAQFNNYKDYIYRHDYNTESISNLWEIVNVLIFYAPYDADHNKEDFCRVILKKNDKTGIITYQNNEEKEGMLN